MSTNHDVSKLDDLIVTTIDSAKGYEHSAEHASAGRFADFFREMAVERRQVIADLSAESRRLGGTPADDGSAAATVHRRIEDLRRVLGGGDAAMLSEVKRGEAYLKEEFDRVLADDGVSPEPKAVVRRAYESVMHGHDRAAALRETATAPL